MNIERLEQLLRTLPRARLAADRDLLIREKILTAGAVLRLGTPSDAWTLPAWFSLPRFVYAPALAAFVLLGTTSAYAYTSSNVTRTSPLYPLRRAVEKVVYPDVSGQTQTKSQLALALRRALEAKALIRRGEIEALAPTLREVNVVTTSANQSLGRLEEIKALEKNINQNQPRAQKLNETLLEVARGIDPQTPAVLDEAALALTASENALEQLATAQLDMEIARAEGRPTVKQVLIFEAQAGSLEDDTEEMAGALEAAIRDLDELEELLELRTRPVIRARQIRAHVKKRLETAETALEAGNLTQAQVTLTAANALLETGEKFLESKEEKE